MRFHWVAVPSIILLGGAFYFFGKANEIGRSTTGGWRLDASVPAPVGDVSGDEYDRELIRQLLAVPSLSEGEATSLVSAAGRRYMRRKQAFAAAKMGKAPDLELEPLRQQMEAARKAREEADAARSAAQVDDPFAALLAEDAAVEAERRAAEQVEAAKQAIRDIHTIDVPVVAVPKVTGSASKVFAVYDFEIEDESLIPMVYRPVDMAAILRDVRAAKEECRIPGIKVTKRTEVK